MPERGSDMRLREHGVRLCQYMHYCFILFLIMLLVDTATTMVLTFLGQLPRTKIDHLNTDKQLATLHTFTDLLRYLQTFTYHAILGAEA